MVTIPQASWDIAWEGYVSSQSTNGDPTAEDRLDFFKSEEEVHDPSASYVPETAISPPPNKILGGCALA